jgi:hypothetical protein
MNGAHSILGHGESTCSVIVNDFDVSRPFVVYLKQTRHWLLMRMLSWPRRPHESLLRRLPGGDFRVAQLARSVQGLHGITFSVIRKELD